MAEYRTGYCGNGHHEGKFELAGNGYYNVACKGEYLILGKTYVCGCDCHTQWRQLEELTGVRAQHFPPRALPKIGPILPALPRPSAQSEFAPKGYDLIKHAYGIRDDGPLASDTDGQPADDRRATTIVEAEMGTPGVSVPAQRRGFSPTPTGRRARGQLEAEVAHIAMKWFQVKAEPVPIVLTPDMVRVQIKTDPPASVGAIYSIFVNWKGQGWAILGDRPFAMIQPTELGLQNLRRWA